MSRRFLGHNPLSPSRSPRDGPLNSRSGTIGSCNNPHHLRGSRKRVQFLRMIEALRSAAREKVTSVSSVSAKPPMVPERYWACFAAKGESQPLGAEEKLRWSPQGTHRMSTVRAAALDGRQK